MRIAFTVLGLLALASSLEARKPVFAPTEGEIAAHRAEVFKIARDYIVESFNLEPVEEGSFNPVRFNSFGVWGDFKTRIKDLGDDRFEVEGWMVPVGLGPKPVEWSVVVRYKLVDPEGWRYRRVDEAFKNEPQVTSWRFYKYRSVPYDARHAKLIAAAGGR